MSSVSKATKTNSQDLTKGAIKAHLVRMTIPMFLGISSMIAASMIETIYIGVLGADELAAYSFTFPLIMGMSSLSMGIGNGAASIIARAEGAGDRNRVRQLVTHALILTTLLVLLLVAVGYTFKQDLFESMGASDRILPLIEQYTDIWILGLALFTWPMVTSTVLRAVGNARLPGIIMTGSSALQVVVAPIMIFGLLGSPELGFIGSAWASILTGSVRTIGMFWVLIGDEKLLLVNRKAISGILRSTREILYIGVPSMLNSLIGPVSMGVILWLLSEHGSSVVAGFGITSRFEMMIMMILMSLSSSIGPFIGQNWGARNIDRIYQALTISYKFSLAWGLATFIILAPFGDNLVSFINDDPLLVESAGWYFLLLPITFGALGIGMISGSLFIALGKPVPTTIMSVFRMTVIHLPLAALFNVYWGFIGIFLATAVSNIIMAVIAHTWSRRVLRAEIIKSHQTDSARY